MEQTIAESAGLRFAAIRAGKWRRQHGVGKLRQLADPGTLGPNLRDLTRIVRGLGKSLVILRQYRPDVVFIKGGFVGLPVGIAARILRIPYVVHESDLHPGQTNRVLAPAAQRIATGFPADKYHGIWPARKVVHTGLPIRSQLVSRHQLEGALRFGFDPKQPVVLVVGGSQGARTINDLMVQIAPALSNHAQVLHLTGEGEIERVRFALGRHEGLDTSRYVAKPFLLEDMGLALAAADIVVARAGATTIAEMAILRKPTIFIPNMVMAGHQLANAQLLSRAGAAHVLKETNLTAPRLQAEILGLLESKEEQAKLSKAIAAFAVADGAERLAQVILDVAAENAGEKAEPGVRDDEDDV